MLEKTEQVDARSRSVFAVTHANLPRPCVHSFHLLTHSLHSRNVFFSRFEIWKQKAELRMFNGSAAVISHTHLSSTNLFDMRMFEFNHRWYCVPLWSTAWNETLGVCIMNENVIFFPHSARNRSCYEWWEGQMYLILPKTWILPMQKKILDKLFCLLPIFPT